MVWIHILMIEKNIEKIICIIIQLIKARVDISFRCVMRSIAGLDNVVQAAIKCNFLHVIIFSIRVKFTLDSMKI